MTINILISKIFSSYFEKYTQKREIGYRKVWRIAWKGFWGFHLFVRFVLSSFTVPPFQYFVLYHHHGLFYSFPLNFKSLKRCVSVQSSHFNHASMDAAANGDGAPFPPLFVSVAALSSSRRHLSASFVERSRPVSSEKPTAWLSLQGRLLNADEASSARTIGGGLSAEQALAWNLFPPIHRFLVVAVIGAAVARSRKDLRICQLKKSVELRVHFVMHFSLYYLFKSVTVFAFKINIQIYCMWYVNE